MDRSDLRNHPHACASDRVKIILDQPQDCRVKCKIHLTFDQKTVLKEHVKQVNPVMCLPVNVITVDDGCAN